MSKLKIKLSENLNVDSILSSISDKYSNYNPILIDGVFIEFDSSWVHLRKSNTEPIIRIFTESKSKEEADELANQFYDLVNENKGSKTTTDYLNLGENGFSDRMSVFNINEEYNNELIFQICSYNTFTDERDKFRIKDLKIK